MLSELMPGRFKTFVREGELEDVKPLGLRKSAYQP